MIDSNRLKGYVALVTGGASGLGKAIAEQFVQENASVVLADLNTSDGQNVADSLNKLKDSSDLPNSIFCSTDITSEHDVSETMKTCETTFGKLNIVVNCAGIFNREKTYDYEINRVHSLDSFKKIIDVNVVGTFNVCRLACPLMAKNSIEEFGERGVIVNISSILAFEGAAYQVAYSTSKAAISGMALPMARDLANIGIRVVTICPGPVETKIFTDFRSANPGVSIPLVFPARACKSKEVAELITSVVMNKMVNATSIRIDGGLRM